MLIFKRKLYPYKIHIKSEVHKKFGWFRYKLDYNYVHVYGNEKILCCFPSVDDTHYGYSFGNSVLLVNQHTGIDWVAEFKNEEDMFMFLLSM